MKPIGGYLSLELPHYNNFMHDDGFLLANCRNALELILLSIEGLRCVWIPYYTCEVVLEPILRLGLEYKQYRINDRFEFDSELCLADDEVIIYTNYFGLKDSYVKQLAEYYGSKLIVDNAQALYAKHIQGTNAAYSPRKFVGIPDGGIAYFSNSYQPDIAEQDQSYDRCSYLLKRIDVSPSFGYADFRETAHKLSNLPVMRMSNLTRKLMLSADYESIKKARKANFSYLHSRLVSLNKLCLPDISTFECPMVYPFWTDIAGLKKYLIDNYIFVATYWPNVLEWCKEDDLEYRITNEVVYIPIDQRYTTDDMEYIINMILSCK